MLISKDEDRSVDADRRDKGERINRSDVSVFVCAATQRVIETICLAWNGWCRAWIGKIQRQKDTFLFFTDIEWCSAWAGANQLLEMM